VHTELTNLKRAYKIEGFNETEIHAVIPDRPGKTKKPEAVAWDSSRAMEPPRPEETYSLNF